MLVFGDTEHGQQVSNLSPWIDAAFAPIEDYLEEVERQTHRRFIKTHTPFDGIPYYPECTYLVIFRDPRDVYISGSNHRDNMNDQDLALSVFPHGENAYSDWLHTSIAPGSWDQQSLELLTRFFQSYWPYRELSNVHLHHYSDMKRNLNRSVRSMAQVLGIDYNEEKLSEFAQAATFDSMKTKAEQFAPEAGTGMWKAEKQFFANGSSGQWQGKLSEQELAAFDARISELLSADEIEWVLNGNGQT